MGLKNQLKSLVPEELVPLVRGIYHLVTRPRWRRVVEVQQRVRTPKNPRTYNEKVRYKMAFDRRPILTVFADKIAARQLVADTIGEDFLSQMFASDSDPAAIPWASLPREFVCKVNHMSGGVILVWDGAPVDARLPENPSDAQSDPLQVRPEYADVDKIIVLCNHWMQIDYSWFPGRPAVEWAYRDIPRAVMIEEVLRDEQGSIPDDYKLLVFNGQVKLIQVFRSGLEERQRDLMTPIWEWLTDDGPYRRSPTPPPEPENLDKMLQAAERLGNLIDFVRVDLYDLGNRIVFGELTNYPAGGNSPLPLWLDRELGSHWRVDDY